MRWKKPALILTLLMLAAAGTYLLRQTGRPPLAAPDARMQTLRGEVTIYRDAYGIPHIHGRNDPAVAFGLAYAHAEDDFPTIQGSLAAARGQLGLLLPGELAGANDFLVQLLDIQQLAETQFAELPAAFQD